MNKQEFFNRFANGNLRKKQYSGYYIYDRDQLTGDEFTCAVLIHQSASIRDAKLPVFCGLHFGNGITIWNEEAHISGRPIHPGCFNVKVNFLHKDYDIVESELVDFQEYKHGDSTVLVEAVIDVDGNDYLLTALPGADGMESVASWRDKRRNIGNRVIPPGLRAMFPLDRKVSSIREARELVTPSGLKDDAVCFGGMFYSPISSKKTQEIDSHIQDTLTRLKDFPNPWAYNLPLTVWDGTPTLLNEHYLLGDRVYRHSDSLRRDQILYRKVKNEFYSRCNPSKFREILQFLTPSSTISLDTIFYTDNPQEVTQFIEYYRRGSYTRERYTRPLESKLNCYVKGDIGLGQPVEYSWDADTTKISSKMTTKVWMKLVPFSDNVMESIYKYTKFNNYLAQKYI